MTRWAETKLARLASIRYFHYCPNMETNAAVNLLAALAQATRLAIFRLLIEAGPTGRAAGEIAHALHAAPATLSFHLKELTRAGLVVPRQDGRYIYYSADFERMGALIAFLTENCCVADGVACGPACGSPAAPRTATPRAARRRDPAT